MPHVLTSQAGDFSAADAYVRLWRRVNVIAAGLVIVGTITAADSIALALRSVAIPAGTISQTEKPGAASEAANEPRSQTPTRNSDDSVAQDAAPEPFRNAIAVGTFSY